jgi:hypothetical protein
MMAKLHEKAYPGNWEWAYGDDIDAQIKRTDDMFSAIDQDRVVRFHIADGYACYYVKSFAPLVLQLIPYGDAYQIPAAHMRGLRRADIEDMIEREKRLRELFSKKGK